MRVQTYYSPLHFRALLIYIFLVHSFWAVISAQGTGESIGYGYIVRKVSVVNSSSSSLFADLQLIKSSSVFGQDIQNLRLTAWYFIFFSILYHLFLYFSCNWHQQCSCSLSFALCKQLAWTATSRIILVSYFSNKLQIILALQYNVVFKLNHFAS